MNPPQEHESLREEVLHTVKDCFCRFKKWYMPQKEKSVWVNILWLLLKTPVMLLVILLSPVVGLILLFTFLAAF